MIGIGYVNDSIYEAWRRVVRVLRVTRDTRTTTFHVEMECGHGAKFVAPGAGAFPPERCRCGLCGEERVG